MTEHDHAGPTYPGDELPVEDRIQEQYLEFALDSTIVGLIVDPTNQAAWVLSDRPRRVDP